MVWITWKGQKDKSLEEIIEKKFRTFVEAVLVTYIQKKPIFEYQDLLYYIENEIIKRALDKQEEFTKLAIRYNSSAYDPNRVASVLAYNGLQYLINSGYVICEKVREIKLRLSKYPESKEMINKIEEIEHKEDGKICISDENAETFMRRHGISPEGYIRKLERGIIQSNPTYRLIVKLKQKIE